MNEWNHSGPVRLITRKSPLALAQTELVREHLLTVYPGVEVEILPVVTTGDRRQGWSLPEKGGKGLFTRELEEALLEGRADLAVHSAKDLPTDEPAGLSLAGFLPRANPQDVLVYRENVKLPSTLASSSPRRRTQAKRMFPQAIWKEIRGNVETRLKKVASGEADATFLAAAGLARLGISEWPGLRFRFLPTRIMVPAAGQGAIALQCRGGEVEKWSAVVDAETARAVTLERAVLAHLGGGCQVAIGVHFENGHLHIFKEEWGNQVLPVDWEEGVDLENLVDEILEQCQHP